MEVSTWPSALSATDLPPQPPPSSEDNRQLYCDSCGPTEFESGDDGYFYCRRCGGQCQDVVETGCADEDVVGDGGGSGALYSFLHRRASSQSTAHRISDAEILKKLSQVIDGGAGEDRERPYRFEEEEPSKPRDFGSEPCPDADTLAEGIRVRYVQGLQVMLQRQCEVMVESFGVSPLVCGLAGTIWLRYVAASRLFEEGWAARVVAEAEAAAARSQNNEQGDHKPPKNIRAENKLEPHDSYGRRIIYVLVRALRKTLPVYSTLAICFLVCHIAREAVVPTDIHKWALEGELLYLAAFTELDKYIGHSSSSCPLSSRFLFRPIRLIGAWQLEATAGSIAQTIGLHLPSVNFYAIAYRYLKDLSISVEKVLPHACRIYEWSMPAELWLSSNSSRLPTRVCVMSILIVTLRILYNIHGQGTWEMGLSEGDGSLPNNSISKVESSNPVQGSDFDAKELLRILEVAYDKISIKYDYSKDLPSYLKYCKDVIFAGLVSPSDEETIAMRLWDIYSKKEVDNQKGKFPVPGEKRSRDGIPINMSLDSNKSLEQCKGGRDEHIDPPSTACQCRCHSACKCSFASSRNDVLQRIKLDMEENGFHYLPPRSVRRTDDYLHYKRKKVDGRLIYAAHADYYILLRAFARLAQVDVRIMHIGVLKLEKRLAWVEQRIDDSLYTLHNFSAKTSMPK